MQKKILIVSDAWQPQVNGVVRTYENLRDELVRIGYDVKVIGPADFPFTVPMPGYAEIRLAVWPCKRLRRMITDYDPDYLHIATEGPLGWAARNYCVRHGKGFSTSYHTHFPDYIAKRIPRSIPFLYQITHALARMVVRKFHAPSKVLIVATKSLENELKSWGFKTPMVRMTRGAKLDTYHPGPKTLFNDLKRPVAIYIGRVSIEKSIEDFLTMPWAGSKVVVGEGPILPTLKTTYPDTLFTGKKTGLDLAEHYRSADVFVFPSRTDTFGIVLIEALASGLPIAGYNVTGPKDIITEDFLGALEDTNLAQASTRALEHGTAEQRADHVKSFYTWEAAARQFMTALNTADPQDN